MGRKLHIGGKVKAVGWEVLDANPGPIVDHAANARDLSFFPDQIFERIYASHVVEHFDYNGELLATLTEWHRVLVPAGILYVSVPDLDILARLFLDRQSLSIEDRFLVMRMIFGGHIDKYDYHLVGLNEEFLGHFLRLAGFPHVDRVERFGMFDDTSNILVHGVPISLNVIATKAG
jgi:predicted SAM-dependent methyltransferase